jgi:methyltransferase (TIGR00027 family)
MQNSINHISDTALWIAAYRAQETKSSHPAFNDHLAEKLAGEKGFEMVATTPHTKSMAFAMIVRTCAIDRLVEIAITKGIDTVINLGAGLDTRPYRMNLPADLNWIEVDFATIIDYKTGILKAENPRCQLERISFDLSQDAERRELFKQLGNKTKSALIITEGVIGYLTNEQATKLSEDLFSIPAFHYWIQDYARGKLRRNRGTKALQKKKLQNVPLQFKVEEPLIFFSRQGWVISENLLILDEADRIGKKLPLFFPWNLLLVLFPRLIRKMGNKAYGYVMFGRP